MNSIIGAQFRGVDYELSCEDWDQPGSPVRDAAGNIVGHIDDYLDRDTPFGRMVCHIQESLGTDSNQDPELYEEIRDEVERTEYWRAV